MTPKERVRANIYKTLLEEERRNYHVMSKGIRKNVSRKK